ncbi:hypothetical protein [Sphingomonas sp.]|uniref:hypothetical protein n=1 Tax=Sphingomonas sp. TaxID=28214 RepID=UPI003B3AA0E1
MNATRRSSRQRTLGTIFAVPLAIGLLCTIGLIAALTGDGARDAVSWAALGAPVAVVGWAMRRSRATVQTRRGKSR